MTMTTSTLRHYLRAAVACCSLALCSLGTLAADYNSLVTQAREQLQADRFIEALASAKDAVRANASDYKGHYYVALAYMGMDRFDDAEAAVVRALNAAPANAKPGVEKLAAAIKTRRQGTGSVQAAEAALADGLESKAARLYEQAWAAGQSNPDLGLKAADLYANRLTQPVDAARVLRQVQAAAAGTPAATKASAELQKLATSLRTIATGHLNAAKVAASPANALRSLQQAEDADPSLHDIFKQRAELVADTGTAPELQSAIKDLARRKLAQARRLAKLPRMAQWLQQPAMAEFLSDMLGPEQMEVLRKVALNPVPAVFKDCADCPEMVELPAGSFQMGGGCCEDLPVHTVTIARAFAMGKTEVTQAQWQALMGNNPSYFKQCGADCPVEQVSWDDAQQFIQKLNAKTGKQYRLPSESEWEYGCRAGDTHKYCGGDDINAVAWYGDLGSPGGNSSQITHRVATKEANAFGLSDMSGNVLEWTQDYYHDTYSGAPSDGSAWVTGGKQYLRVLRGGSWFFGREFSLGYRHRDSQSSRSYHSGFRLARTLFTP